MNDQRLRPAPESRFDEHSLVFDLAAEAATVRAEGPAPHGHRQKTLYKHGNRTIAMFALEPGACIREHRTAGPVTIQVVEGEITVVADGQPHRLCVGKVLVLAPKVAHEVSAEHAASFLLQVSLVVQ
ncbi:MAG TPA: cupin domain-containing protein [Phycisphaerales bacterium]